MNVIGPTEVTVLSDRQIEEGIFMHLQAQTESLQQISKSVHIIAVIIVLFTVLSVLGIIVSIGASS